MSLYENIQAAKDPLTPLLDLEKLSLTGSHEVLTALAKNPSSSYLVLSRLVFSRDPDVLAALASNPKTSKWMLEVLADEDPGDYPFTVLNTASNPNTGIFAFSRLAKSPLLHARTRAARNKKAPGEILRTLAKDPHLEVKRNVAENPNTPPDVLLELSHLDELTRIHVSRNASTPFEVLNDLLDFALAKETFSQKILNALAVNKSLSREALQKLISSAPISKNYPWNEISFHPNMDTETLQLLPAYIVAENSLKSFFPQSPFLEALLVFAKDYEGTLFDLVEMLTLLNLPVR